MRDAISLFAEVLPAAPWAFVAVILTKTLVIHLRAYVVVETIIDDVRLSLAIRRLKANGGKRKQIRHLIEDDHKQRARRSR